jgi:hypothetical protein
MSWNNLSVDITVSTIPGPGPVLYRKLSGVHRNPIIMAFQIRIQFRPLGFIHGYPLIQNLLANARKYFLSLTY